MAKTPKSRRRTSRRQNARPNDRRSGRRGKPRKSARSRRSTKHSRPSLLRRIGRAVIGPRARRIYRWSGLGLFWTVFVLALFVAYYAHDLPDVQDILAERRPPVVTLLATDGSRLTTYGGGHSDWLGIGEMSPLLPTAVMAIEDRRFYEHSGIDLYGLTRAMLANLRAGSIVQGGSTLTQQLAKNLFLTPERTIRRKVQEILLAFWLESRFTKNEILELYLNRVYLGGGAYGVDAAARRYFGKSATELDLGESALIAGLLKAPSRFAPTADPSAGYARMNIVLDAMVDAGYVGPVARGLVGRPEIVEMQLEAGERYFTDWVMSRLGDLVGQPGSDLTVFTTADPELQHLAQAELSKTLAEQGVARQASQGAVVLMKEDGAVKALVGGADYRQSEFNRATNALRQPGSAFKLFVYLSAFEVGLSPSSRMRDSPFILEGWQPSNYTDEYRGTVTLREAFAKSINTVAVKLGERVDRTRVINMAKRLGITTPVVRQPSTALGTSEVKLIELVSAYAVIARGGLSVEPYGISRIETPDRQVLFERVGGAERLLSPSVVRNMRTLLQETVETGTGRAARLPGRPAYGKTGTSQEFRDAWFLGFSGPWVGGVWIGNDDGTPMQKVTGGNLPAQIWKRLMTVATER